MLESVERLREKICTILGSRDVRSAHSLGMDEVSDEVPPNINVLRPTVKDRVLG